MDQVMQFVEPSRQFVKDSIRLVKRCTKPDRKEFQKIAMATAIGFAIMGFIGFFVKLIHIPINNIIVLPPRPRLPFFPPDERPQRSCTDFSVDKESGRVQRERGEEGEGTCPVFLQTKGRQRTWGKDRRTHMFFDALQALPDVLPSALSSPAFYCSWSLYNHRLGVDLQP
ncbi:protein transport protein Sec61 subunit gamma isoform X3 [Kogia breviceps]|uniref:protein transport protein Sec61 subunit gamma isoform X3 n=1 Tax=Kogia breviceps TaxID=27615 RepID=UPI0034D21B4E